MDKTKSYAKMCSIVLLAHSEGKAIQYRTYESPHYPWIDITDSKDLFDCIDKGYELKLKPELIYAPFCYENGVEILGRDVYGKDDDENYYSRYHILGVGKDIIILKKQRTSQTVTVYFDRFLSEFNFAGNIPCGKCIGEKKE